MGVWQFIFVNQIPIGDVKAYILATIAMLALFRLAGSKGHFIQFAILVWLQWLYMHQCNRTATVMPSVSSNTPTNHMNHNNPD